MGFAMAMCELLRFLGVFLSQRVAHQVIATKGDDLWFCIWFSDEITDGGGPFGGWNAWGNPRVDANPWAVMLGKAL